MRRIVKKKYCKLIDFHVYDKRPIPGEKEDNYGLDDEDEDEDEDERKEKAKEKEI